MALTDPFDVTVVVTAQSAESAGAEAHFLAFHRAGRLVDAHRARSRGCRPPPGRRAKITIGMYSASIVAKITTASRRRPTMYPSVQTIAIGMIVIDQVSTRFESGVGFSYGCAEFGPK